MDIIQFFGRFHVLVLHLPIGILMLAALFEIYTIYKKISRNPLINAIWFWGAVSAIFACILGWLLSQGGGYTADAVFIHRTFGLLTALVAVITYLYVTFIQSRIPLVILVLSIGQLFLLFNTGHYGANMTHGETYLVDKAPNIVRTALGFAEHAIPREKITSLEQADVYLDVIEPMLQKRCVSCHNDNKQKGKLNLNSIEGLFKGGKSGKAIAAKDLQHSKLYKRITLEHDEKGFMPAEGKTPFSQEQTKAIAWWINAGAPTQGKVTDYIQQKQDKTLLSQLFDLNSNGFNLPAIEAISLEQEQGLVDGGFVIKRLSQKHQYLDLDLSVKNSPLTDQGLLALLSVKQHVVALNLRKTQVTDLQLSQIGKLSNLMKLKLNQNTVSNEGIKHLTSLSKLRYLNLYKTAIDEGLLDTLMQFSSLEKVFVGETNISFESAKAFSAKSNILLQGVLPVTPSVTKKEK